MLGRASTRRLLCVSRCSRPAPRARARLTPRLQAAGGRVKFRKAGTMLGAKWSPGVCVRTTDNHLHVFALSAKTPETGTADAAFLELIAKPLAPKTGPRKAPFGVMGGAATSVKGTPDKVPMPEASATAVGKAAFTIDLAKTKAKGAKDHVELEETTKVGSGMMARSVVAKLQLSGLEAEEHKYLSGMGWRLGPPQ